MSSPSVVFTDDQALLADKGTLYSSTSEEAASSITSINHDENSQPESQVRTWGKGAMGRGGGNKEKRKGICKGWRGEGFLGVK